MCLSHYEQVHLSFIKPPFVDRVVFQWMNQNDVVGLYSMDTFTPLIVLESKWPFYFIVLFPTVTLTLEKGNYCLRSCYHGCCTQPGHKDCLQHSFTPGAFKTNAWSGPQNVLYWRKTCPSASYSDAGASLFKLRQTQLQPSIYFSINGVFLFFFNDEIGNIVLPERHHQH